MSKRRRISEIQWEPVEVEQTGYTLETLPPEVLETILTYLPLQVVASTFRLVSKRCQTVAQSLLNGAFYSTGQKLDSAIAYAQDRISTVKNNTDIPTFTKALHVLQMVHIQYRLLRAVTWRYTHPPRPERFPRLCFYPGGLLDQLNHIIYISKCQPQSLVGPNAPDVVTLDFSNLCKKFMNYFERISEKKLNRNLLISGCKAVDILDCLNEGRQVISFRVTPGRGKRGSIVCMKLQYTMRRAWFTCLPVPKNAEENNWKEEQRFMYLRLRRLVASVNEHYYENLNFEREAALQERTKIATKIPYASTYSGYGEYGGQFFYYGNMNKQAFATKWHQPAETEDSLDVIEEHPLDNEKYPTFALKIGIELRCSPELAPLMIRPILKSDDLDNTRPPSHNPEMYLKMTVNCPASLINRLPSHFVWEQRERKRRSYS